MKKILFININDSSIIGGREIYNKFLINTIKEKFNAEITEFSFNFEPIKKNQSHEKITHKIINVSATTSLSKNKLMFFNRINKGYKMLKKITNQYDYFFISNYFLSKKFEKIIPRNKAFWIQHNDCDFYTFKHVKLLKSIKFYKIINFGFNVFFRYKATNYFCDNHIYYTKNDLDKFTRFFPKTIAKNNYIFYLNDTYLKRKSKKELLVKKPELLYLSRIDQEQKNINFIFKLSKHLKYKINIYGNDEKDKIPENSNLVAHGIVNNEDKEKVYDKYFFTILLSFFEGAPLVLTNSLTYQVPIITCNTYSNSYFLTNNNKNGLNIDIEKIGFNVKKVAKIINNYLDFFLDTNNNLNNNYIELTKNCYDFALKQINFESFQKKWISLFEKIIDKKL